MDVLHKVLGWVDHNRGVVVALLIGLIASVSLVSCAPTTTSIIDLDRKVTAEQLQREIIITQQGFAEQAGVIYQLQAEHNARVEATNAQIEAAGADIQRQREERLKIIELLGGIGTMVAQGGFSGPSAIASVVQLVSVIALGGLVYDNRRKSRVIGDEKKKNASLPPPPAPA